MIGSDLLARNDHDPEPKYTKPGSNDLKPLFSDGSVGPQPTPSWRAPVPAVVLDMGEASREQGFRQNGCR